MSEYQVTVKRTVSQTLTFTVDADDEESAEQAAVEQVSEHWDDGDDTDEQCAILDCECISDDEEVDPATPEAK